MRANAFAYVRLYDSSPFDFLLNIGLGCLLDKLAKKTLSAIELCGY